MRYLSTIIICISLCIFSNIYAKAQNPIHEPDSVMILKDSTISEPLLVDTSLISKSIFEILPSYTKGDSISVTIYQSPKIFDGFTQYIEDNKNRDIHGYRLRIYFDNKQNSRTESNEVSKKFNSQYPFIKTYTSYQNPFFKVSVGDFRFKSNAMRLLNKIKAQYPSAFIIKENINYAPIDLQEYLFYNNTKIQ